MTRHDIIALPNPHLRKNSKSIDKKDLKSAAKLAEHMKAVALDWEHYRKHEFGVALAAIQVNKPLQVIVIRQDWRDKDNRDFDVYINPKVTRYDGEPIIEPEGCISVVDIYGAVARYPKVKIKAINLQGEPIKLVAKGFLARVFQHEIDHINGITFVDRCGEKGTFYKLSEDGGMTALTDNERAKFLKKVGLKPLSNYDEKVRKN